MNSIARVGIRFQTKHIEVYVCLLGLRSFLSIRRLNLAIKYKNFEVIMIMNLTPQTLEDYLICLWVMECG